VDIVVHWWSEGAHSVDIGGLKERSASCGRRIIDGGYGQRLSTAKNVDIVRLKKAVVTGRRHRPLTLIDGNNHRHCLS